ncbi:MAG TPA: glycosyltransferase family 9 protein, partial [Verrucomicrobiae bacterium]|nr:glycosyltransferase family 9 protein [Verrucomicrobiae bacterium]
SRVAHRGSRWHFYNPWLIRDWIPRQDPTQLVSEQRRQMLAACGLSLEPTRFALRIEEDSARWAAGMVHGSTVHISPNSNKAVKEWPLEYYLSLANSLLAAEPPLNIVISGTTRERERARLDALAAKLKSDRVRFLRGGVSISQLAALLARCCLHIGSDSGVLHLAFALQIPTISFLREQPNFGAFLPIGPMHRVFRVPCPCVDGPDAPCGRLQRAECLAKIEPQSVAQVVKEQLSQCKAPEKASISGPPNSPHPSPLSTGEGG